MLNLCISVLSKWTSIHHTELETEHRNHFISSKQKKWRTHTITLGWHVINIGPIMRRVGRRPSNSMNARRRRIIIMNAENDSAESPRPSRPTNRANTSSVDAFHCDIFRTTHRYRPFACQSAGSVGQPTRRVNCHSLLAGCGACVRV